MAESAVLLLADKLALPYLQEQLNLLCGVREDIEYIRDELERMSAFLRVADSLEESDQEIHVWVKQVREVAHHTEDVIDLFMLHFRTRHHRQDNRCLVLFRRTFRFIKNIKHRFQIGSEIRSIRDRVKEIAEGHQRYRLKPNVLLLQEGSSSTTQARANNTWYDMRGDALLVPEAELVGIDKSKQELIQFLVEEADDQNSRGLKVVSVVGMGGLGKTTLVKKVYDDAPVKKHFDSHAWLTLSESPDMKQLLIDMIQQLYGEAKQQVPQELGVMDINRLKAVINEFLQQRRYLVVLDDIWNTNVWEAVKYAFPNTNDSSSRIMVTTRFVDIASTCCSETDGEVHRLNFLSEEESWSLFCRKVFRGICPHYLEGICRGILKRCEGLPLAIVAIGGVLATKDQSRIDEWDMLGRSLGGNLQDNNQLQSLKNILSLSYNDLPWYLKICFLYLSIFPEDYEIDCWRLIRLWTAEGFVQVREASGKTIEEVAEGYLYDLLNRCLIQVAETTVDGRPKTCRVHDLMREMTTSMSREQNIVSVIAAAAASDNTSLPDGVQVRRISIHSKMLGNTQEESSNRLSQIRSWFMFGVVEALTESSAPLLFSGELMLLKVLDLRGACLETIPDKVCKMFNLTYLSLRDTKVKVIPRSIGNLRNLETLDLKKTSVTVLPVEILKLQQLRHLRVYGDSVTGFEGLEGIGGLTSLQELRNMEASDGGIVRELGKLTQLRSLDITKLRRGDGKALCSSLEKMSNLHTLSMMSIVVEEILDIQSLSSPPPLLRKLRLRGGLDKLPDWILSLHNLVNLRLAWSKLRDDPLQMLQDLPNLMELEITDGYQGEELCFKAGGFRRLKLLYLTELKGLKRVVVEEGAMPCLETLDIWDCEMVKEVPSGIQFLTQLERLLLCNMHEELLKKLDRTQGGADYWKIAHIPIARSGFYENGEFVSDKNLHRLGS